jgi:hypothetical protein
MNGYVPPGTTKERRRVSGRSIEFGLTQRPFQRLDGGQDPIPGRHGVGEDGHSALDSIITPPGQDINLEFPHGSAIASVPVNGHRRPIR